MADFMFDGTGVTGWVFDGNLPPNPPAAGFTPAGYKFETYPGRGGNFVNNVLTLATGTVQATAIWLPGAQSGLTVSISKLAVMTGATAGATMTHWWYALLDITGQVRAVTADQVAAAIPANTLISLATTAAYTPSYSGLYYLAVMVTATTPPSLHSTASTANLNGLATVLGGASSAGQTTPPALLASLTVPTAGANLFYGCAG